MSLHTSNPDLELQAIYSLCRSPDTIKALLISRLDKSHFYTKAATAAFNIIKRHFSSKAKFTSWTAICSTPALNEIYRDRLRTFKEESNVKSITKDSQVEELIDLLDSYRQVRVALDTAKLVEAATKSPEPVEIQDLLTSMRNKMNEARSKHSKNETFAFGRGNTDAIDELWEKLSSQQEGVYLPTGFEGFDRENIGIKRQHTGLIAGRSGHGKSALAINMALNMAKAGFKVVYCPLEQDCIEITQRLLARLTQIELSTIIRPVSWTEQEKSRLKKALYNFNKRISKTSGGEFILDKPKTSITFDEAIANARVHFPDAIFIDYITLLKGTREKDQVFVLGQISQASKAWAIELDCVIINIAQLSHEGRVKYAQSLNEDANHAWFIDYHPEDPSLCMITLSKNRQGSTEGYLYLRFRRPVMTFEDVEDGFRPPKEKNTDEKGTRRKSIDPLSATS